MITVIDNYDSFTWNLVQMIEEISGEPVQVLRNDAFDPAELLASAPAGIVISPGPGTPSKAGNILELIQRNERVPLLGICLGHQAIGQAFGGKVIRSEVPVHGKVMDIDHGGKRLFEGCPVPMRAARYHSLVVERGSLPGELEVDAETSDGVVMAVSHRDRPLFGIQFHPESYGTVGGALIVKNFLARLAR